MAGLRPAGWGGRPGGPYVRSYRVGLVGVNRGGDRGSVGMVDKALPRAPTEQSALGVPKEPVSTSGTGREQLDMNVGLLADDREPQGLSLHQYERVELPERGH